MPLASSLAAASSASAPFVARADAPRRVRHFGTPIAARRASSSPSAATTTRPGPTARSTLTSPSRVVRARSVSEPPAAPAESDLAASAPADGFDWHKAWYPMSPVDFLDPDAPNAMKLLGAPLVAWRAENGAWSVVADSCPHRMAPLSLGFLSAERRLVCRYHGWEFGGDGAAKAIPMSVDAAAEKTACESSRSCATSYPCKEEAGVLWVWPTPGADAWLEASQVPVATAAAPLGELPGEWGMVELPVGYAPALENQFDPSHAEWLHAKYDPETGFLSDQNAKYEPMTAFEVVPGTMNAGGFTVKHGGYNAGNKDVSAERLFTAPCSSRSEYEDKNGKRYLSAAILYTPTEPGRCLMFTKFQAHQRSAVQGAGRAKVTTGDRVRALLTAPAEAAFRWYMEFQVSRPDLVRVGLVHGVYGNAAYTLGDQDIQAMHGVEVAMEAAEEDWKKAYYLPAPADAGVAGFRRWMDAHAGGGVRWARGVSDDASKVKPIEQQLDRYHRHTKHCRHCRECLNELGALEAKLVDLTTGACAASVLLGVGGAVVGQEAPAVVALGVAGLATGAAERVRDMQSEFLTSVKRRGDPIPKLW